MEISVAEERILLLKEQLSAAEAEEIAWKRKSDAFGAIQKMTSFLNRPKEDDFELAYKEHRYEPFWHIAATAKYIYDRKTQHQWPATGTEVTTLTLENKKYDVQNGHITVSVIEHCNQEERQEIFVEGLSGTQQPTLGSYLKFSSTEMGKSDLEKLSQSSVVVPPKARASALVREIASKMIHSIQADQIFEEGVEFQHVDLYYRPVFAFKYRWGSKNKEAVVEVDGLTSQVEFSQKSFQHFVGKVLDYDFLFDVGSDAAGMFLPGGSIAVKLAKKYIDVKRKRK